jgi:hypothetical protein
MSRPVTFTQDQIRAAGDAMRESGSCDWYRHHAEAGGGFRRRTDLSTRRSFNFPRASNIDHCSGFVVGDPASPIDRSMEYRGIEYTVVRDERGEWQWTVSLGNPETIESGQAASKGTAILKVWAAIDRAHPRASWKSRLNVTGKEVPPQNRQAVQGHSVKPTSTP